MIVFLMAHLWGLVRSSCHSRENSPDREAHRDGFPLSRE
jgi:hypothetical protein